MPIQSGFGAVPERVRSWSPIVWQWGNDFEKIATFYAVSERFRGSPRAVFVRFVGNGTSISKGLNRSVPFQGSFSATYEHFMAKFAVHFSYFKFLANWDSSGTFCTISVHYQGGSRAVLNGHKCSGLVQREPSAAQKQISNNLIYNISFEFKSLFFPLFSMSSWSLTFPLLTGWERNVPWLPEMDWFHLEKYPAE